MAICAAESSASSFAAYRIKARGINGSSPCRFTTRVPALPEASRLAYPVRDGIPVMLEDQARPLTEDEAKR